MMMLSFINKSIADWKWEKICWIENGGAKFPSPKLLLAWLGGGLSFYNIGTSFALLQWCIHRSEFENSTTNTKLFLCMSTIAKKEIYFRNLPQISSSITKMTIMCWPPEATHWKTDVLQPYFLGMFTTRLLNLKAVLSWLLTKVSFTTPKTKLPQSPPKLKQHTKKPEILQIPLSQSEYELDIPMGIIISTDYGFAFSSFQWRYLPENSHAFKILGRFFKAIPYRWIVLFSLGSYWHCVFAFWSLY